MHDLARSFGLLAAAVLSTAFSETSYGGNDPLDDPEVHKTLRAMDDASTWFHPNLAGEFAGVARYARHNYSGAMKFFEVGSFYADKFSQLSIGLMYLNGEGVRRDRATALAWFEIAAERGYPQFVATRDRVRASLSSAEIVQADNLRDQLSLRYADIVAKPRMEQQLRFGLEQMTGSRLGFNFGIYHVVSSELCKGSVIVQGMSIPRTGCGGEDVYAPDRWNPDKYFAQRDAQWRATVSVGDIVPARKPLEKKRRARSIDILRPR